MTKKALILIVLLMLSVAGIISVNPSSANFFPDPGPDLPRIYIRSNGDVEPETAPIERLGNNYKLTGDIVMHTIVIQRDNIVLDGSGYLIKGNGSWMGLAKRLGDGGNNGIVIASQSYINITGFTIEKYTTGLRLTGSSRINIMGNSFGEGAAVMDTPKGIVFEDSSFILIKSNSFSSIHGSAITGKGTDVSIKDNTLIDIKEGNDGCISLEGSSNKIENNKIQASSFIKLDNADFNTIANNSLSGRGNGIFFWTECSNNQVTKNNLSDCAVRIIGGTNNTFRENSFIDVEFPIDLSGGHLAEDNLFYGNTFGANSYKIRINNVEGTLWDNGMVGNYWGNYNGSDSNGDGIGDTPYIVSGYKWSDEVKGDIVFVAVQDNYPLMNSPLLKPFDFEHGTLVLSPEPPFQTLLVVFVSVIALVCVASGLLVYFNKYKLKAENA